MKKQWLIPLNSTLFCCNWICTWTTFWIYIVSFNVVKQSNYFLILILSVILLMQLFVYLLCFPPLVKIIINCLMSNFLISLFFRFGLIDYVLRILWSCQYKKKHIAYISMMGLLCSDMKVSTRHNLMKKQWLIALNSTLFWCDWICTWMTFWIYIFSINIVKR